MSEHSSYEYELVDRFPDIARDGVLYVSMGYATSMHRCMCGCRESVVTPLSPTDWRMTYDGETISLAPSIGNWSMPCQSHYWLDHGQVRWAGAWTRDEIEAGRDRDRARKAHAVREDVLLADEPIVTPERLSWCRRFVRRLRR